jgi:hypothetical protein
MNSRSGMKLLRMLRLLLPRSPEQRPPRRLAPPAAALPALLPPPAWMPWSCAEQVMLSLLHLHHLWLLSQPLLLRLLRPLRPLRPLPLMHLLPQLHQPHLPQLLTLHPPVQLPHLLQAPLLQPLRQPALHPPLPAPQ